MLIYGGLFAVLIVVSDLLGSSWWLKTIYGIPTWAVVFMLPVWGELHRLRTVSILIAQEINRLKEIAGEED